MARFAALLAAGLGAAVVLFASLAAAVVVLQSGNWTNFTAPVDIVSGYSSAVIGTYVYNATPTLVPSYVGSIVAHTGPSYNVAVSSSYKSFVVKSLASRTVNITVSSFYNATCSYRVYAAYMVLVVNITGLYPAISSTPIGYVELTSNVTDGSQACSFSSGTVSVNGVLSGYLNIECLVPYVMVNASVANLRVVLWSTTPGTAAQLITTSDTSATVTLLRVDQVQHQVGTVFTKTLPIPFNTPVTSPLPWVNTSNIGVSLTAANLTQYYITLLWPCGQPLPWQRPPATTTTTPVGIGGGWATLPPSTITLPSININVTLPRLSGPQPLSPNISTPEGVIGAALAVAIYFALVAAMGVGRGSMVATSLLFLYGVYAGSPLATILAIFGFILATIYLYIREKR